MMFCLNILQDSTFFFIDLLIISFSDRILQPSEIYDDKHVYSVKKYLISYLNSFCQWLRNRKQYNLDWNSYISSHSFS